MKYKDWWNQQQRNTGTLPSPVGRTPIICPDCKNIVGYYEDYMFMNIEHPIVCPKCDEIVIMPNIVKY